MAVISGRVRRVAEHEEEGRTDWALALSKIGWFIIFFLAPLSLFRFVNDLFGVVIAGVTIFLLLVILRLAGPFNLVMFDEIICRVFPTLRTAFRTGRVRVFDFRVHTENGTQVACILRGDLLGQSPMVGDEVTVTGDFQLGTLFVKNGQNNTTNACFSLREDHSGKILLLSLGLIALFCFYLQGAFDVGIYMLIDKLLTLFAE